eukprot:gene9153-1241_t
MKRKLQTDNKTTHKKFKNQKPVEFIPELLNNILSFLPQEDKFYSNFTKVSKQFYEIFYDSPFSSSFKLKKILNDTDELEFNEQLKNFEKMKTILKKKESDLKSIELQNTIKQHWITTLRKKKDNPYSNEAMKVLETIPENIKILETSEINASCSTDKHCHLKLFDVDLCFNSLSLDTYRGENGWSVRTSEKTIIDFKENDDEKLYFDVSLNVMKKVMNLKLSDDEYIDMFNDLASFVVEVDMDHSTSEAYHLF